MSLFSAALKVGSAQTKQRSFLQIYQTAYCVVLTGSEHRRLGHPPSKEAVLGCAFQFQAH